MTASGGGCPLLTKAQYRWSIDGSEQRSCRLPGAWGWRTRPLRIPPLSGCTSRFAIDPRCNRPEDLRSHPDRRTGAEELIRGNIGVKISLYSDVCHVWPMSCLILSCLIYVMSDLCHVWPMTCLIYVMPDLCHVWPKLCLAYVMSDQCHVWPISCLIYVMSDLCHVWPMSCLTYVISDLSCLTYVMSDLSCLTYVMSAVCHVCRVSCPTYVM